MFFLVFLLSVLSKWDTTKYFSAQEVAIYHSIAHLRNRPATMKVTGAILVGILILGGCAEGKRARGQQKYNGYVDYRKGHPVKHAKNLNAALVGIDLPSFRPYGEFPN